MTNNPTIDGVSRELLQKTDDLLYIMTGHDSYARLVHKYGKEWWTPINALRAEICTLLAAPAVEPPNALREHCKQCAEVVKTWPEWKRNCLGGAPVVERQDRMAHSMKSVAEAVDASRCYTVLTSNQCYALAQSLNNQAVRVSAVENDALQSTIARLEARVAELESGLGEYAGETGSMPGTSGFTMAVFKAEDAPAGTKLFTTPPLSVAVVLPERLIYSAENIAGKNLSWTNGWNACLDATAALNGEKS